MLPEVRHGDPDLPAVPLIDREREVAEMRAALEATLRGSGRVMLVAGEPGVGKTHLARVLADQAGTRGVPVWWGRGWEDDSAPVFWLWNAALRSWIHRAGREAAAAAARPWLPDLAHVFPVLHDRTPDVPPSGRWESERSRFRVFDIVSRYLAAVAAPAGLVVVLDDVHWADGLSLKLLEFVAATLRDTRVLIVATYRDSELRRERALFATLSQLAREASTHRLHLKGLSAAHCTRWAVLAGVRSSDPVALGESLYRETSGNPFLLGEIVRLLASGGDLGAQLDGRRIPQSVREVVSRRLDRLGDGCRTTLAVAALIGDTIDTSILRQVLDDAQAADRLERAAHDGILLRIEGSTGQYRFAHALFRRVLAGDLEASERAVWHARIATVLEPHAGASDVVTTELIHHLAGADSPDALRKAFDYASRGAERAARGRAWDNAVRLYEIALDVGGRCGAIDAERAIELRIALARALRRAGDVPAARARCEEAMAACRRIPRPALLARAALVHVGPMPEFGRVDPIERAILEEACQNADGIDDGLRARLLARLAGDVIAANESERGRRVLALCDDAARAARRAGDASALAMAQLGTLYAAVLRMRPPANDGPSGGLTVPSPHEILEAAEAGGNHDSIAAVRHLRAMIWLAIGDAEGFSAEVDGIAVVAAASRAPGPLWRADALGALRATVEGRFADAHDLIERALVTGRSLQLPNTAGTYAAQRIMWHMAQGRLAEIAPEIEAFVDGHPRGAGWRPVRAIARLACGDAPSARTEFHGVVATVLGSSEPGAISRCHLAGVALLCVALRDREHAPMLYERVARQAEAWIVGGCLTLGPWALVLGSLARLCGRSAEAARHFEAAIRQGERMRSRPIVARAQSLLAGVCLSTHLDAYSRRQVASMLAEASQSARQLGLADVRARVDRLQAKLAGCRNEAIQAFRCEGEVWTVSYGGREIRLKDGKGPRYLATLLAAPGHEFHVLQLAAGAPNPEITAAPPDELPVGEPGGALDDAPDARARREYRSRLDHLHADIAEAERLSDRERAERLRAELELLRSQLSARFGTRDRMRGPAENARKAVTKVLRTQIGKLLDLHPALAQHLLDTVRMGAVCVYAPPTPNHWNVLFG